MREAVVVNVYRVDKFQISHYTRTAAGVLIPLKRDKKKKKRVYEISVQVAHEYTLPSALPSSTHQLLSPPPLFSTPYHTSLSVESNRNTLNVDRYLF